MKQKGVWLILLIMYAGAAFSSPGNVSSYVFSQITGTYNTISTSGTYISGSCGSSTFGNLPIGFTFVYDGVSYTQFGMCCNGWISMGPAAPTNSTVPISSGVSNNVIVPFASQLASTVAGNGIYYKTEGNAPNRILTVEWWQYGFWFNGFDEVCFQVKLYETSNEIRFVYTTNDILSIRTIQVGLRGNSNADYNNRMTTTNWSQTTPGTSNASTCAFQSGCTPVSGLTFIFTPPATNIENTGSGIPDEFGLKKIYPNPFNQTSVADFYVPSSGIVKITLCDISGRKIKTVISGNFPAGTHSVMIDAGNLASGVYFLRMDTEDLSDIRKIVLMK